MKKTLLYFVLINLFVANVFASNNFEKATYFISENQGELVVTYESFNDKLMLEFDAAVATIPGLKTTGYCQKLNCYYYSYDKEIYPSLQAAFDALTEKTKSFQPLLKEGTTSEMVRRNCVSL